MEIQGVSALVTGGVSGLGRATTERLLAAGANVVMIDLNEEAGAKAAEELAESLIRVVTIAPGIFETPMMAGLPQEAQDSLGKMVPHPARLGKPAEYAQLVESIVRNPMLNGDTIRLDGAIRMQPK